MIRNALSNLAGAAVPALVMLVTVPIFVKGLGQADYGLFVIVTSITGYMAVLDINISAGSMKFLAEAQAHGDEHRIDAVLGFGAAFYGAVGIAGGLLMLAFAEPLITLVAGDAAGSAGIAVLRIAALGFLLGQLYGWLLGVPQAFQRYDLSARIEIINGVVVSAASALVVAGGLGLTSVMWLRNGLALVSIASLAWLLKRHWPRLDLAWPTRGLRSELLSFSGYAYLTRLAGLSYQHSDKLMVGALLGTGAVALYAVPVLLANRIMGMSYRLTQVIFPLSTALFARGAEDEVRRLVLANTRYVLSLNVAMVVLLTLGAHALLDIWMGAEFAEKGATVLAWIALGALLDSVTNAPSLVTDGAGRPGVSGAFAICRALAGLAGIYVGAQLDGIVGVAASHAIVSLLAGLCFMVYFDRRVLSIGWRPWLLYAFGPGLLTGGASLLAGLLVIRMWGAAATPYALAASALVAGAAGLRFVLGAAERKKLVRWCGMAG